MAKIYKKQSQKILKIMNKEHVTDFKNANRKTKDPDNNVNEEIVRLEEEAKLKMLKDRAGLRNSKILDWVVNFVLEIISFFDIISDVAVLVVLVAQKFILFSAASLFVMLSAIIVCYSPLINFFIARNTIRARLGQNIKFSCKNLMFTFIYLTPLITVLLTVIDCIYTINQLFVEPLVLLINIIMCNAYRNDGENWIETEPYLDGLFMYFNMDTMDVKGYRRLRTIS